MDKIFKVGDKVRYTTKDGRIIYGVVKALYLESTYICKKDGKTYKRYPSANVRHDHDGKTINYRSRRLDYVDNVIIPGNFLMALMPVITNSEIEEEQYKWVYTCGQGVFAIDQHRIFLEKMAGLKNGCITKVGGKPIVDLLTNEIKQIDLNSNDLIVDNEYVKNCIGLLEQHEMKRSTMTIEMDTVEINRAIKDMRFHKGKSSRTRDLIELGFDFSKKSILFKQINRKSEVYNEGAIEDVIITCDGKIIGPFIFRLCYLKEFFRWIRTKTITLRFVASKSYVLLEGDLQWRVLYFVA